MLAIKDISEGQLFQGLTRTAGLSANRGVCKILKAVDDNTIYTVWGTFSARASGMFIGAQIYQDQTLLNTLGPNRLSKNADGSPNLVEGIGIIGELAGQVVNAAQDPSAVTSDQLFGDRITGETNMGLRYTVPDSAITGANPTEPISGICDKLNWVRVNDASNHVLWINWIFGPGWAAAGAAVRNLAGTLQTNFPAVTVDVPESRRFYQAVGELTNVIAGNAVLWVRG